MAERLDQALVRLGYAVSRARAQALIKAGKVTASGQVVRKPAAPVTDAAAIALLQADHPWVGRGALKLLGAVDAFSLDFRGCHVLDIGASTGGFSQVALAGGAAHVTAVDVGRGQLHDLLRADHRVTALEGLDARDLRADHLTETPDCLVCDVSFISVRKALGIPLSMIGAGGFAVLLVKPQFETERANIGKGGLVRSPGVQQQALAAVSAWVDQQPGWQTIGTTDSPIAGGDGNKEFLLYARKEKAVG